MTGAKKRFIAGVICPRCRSMDTIRVYRQNEVDIRECVACDFSDEMRFQTPVRELETRVNVSETQKQRETQVVRILDTKKTR